MSETMLVTLDHAGCGIEVADQAADLAARLGQHAVLLHVVKVPPGVGATHVVLHCEPCDIDGETALEGLAHDAIAALRAFAASFESRGVPTRIEVRTGLPAKAILAAAEAHGASMIAVGTHGRTGLARTILGSVAEEVIRSATCPVVTIRMQAGEAGMTAAQAQALAESDG